MIDAQSVSDVADALENGDLELPVTFYLAATLPKSHGVPISDLVTVWTDEWDDEDERWGIANNGTGAYRLWHGPIYHLDTDRICAVEHPAGSIVIAVDEQALCVLRPDGGEWFVEPGHVDPWETAVIYALHGRHAELGTELPPADEMVERTEPGGPN